MNVLVNPTASISGCASSAQECPMNGSTNCTLTCTYTYK